MKVIFQDRLCRGSAWPQIWRNDKISTRRLVVLTRHRQYGIAGLEAPASGAGSLGDQGEAGNYENGGGAGEYCPRQWEISQEQYDAPQREIIETENALRIWRSRRTSRLRRYRRLRPRGRSGRHNISSIGKKVLPVTGCQNIIINETDAVGWTKTAWLDDKEIFLRGSGSCCLAIFVCAAS